MDTDLLFFFYGTIIFLSGALSGWTLFRIIEEHRHRRYMNQWREAIKYENSYGRNRERK